MNLFWCYFYYDCLCGYTSAIKTFLNPRQYDYNNFDFFDALMCTLCNPKCAYYEAIDPNLKGVSSFIIFLSGAAWSH